MCDRYEESYDRTDDLVRDRPLFIGDAAALPFKDKSIDYVICQHLVEHLETPEIAFAEFERVGKRGLIRTPSPLAEKLISRDVHRWYVSVEDDRLTLRQKETIYLDEQLTHALLDNRQFWQFFGRCVEAMETVFRWDGSVRYLVERRPAAVWDGKPLESPEVAIPARAKAAQGKRRNRWLNVASRGGARRLGWTLLGHAYRHGVLRRPRSVDWAAILACPACHGSVAIGETVRCHDCGLEFPVRNGVPVMLLSEAQHKGIAIESVPEAVAAVS